MADDGDLRHKIEQRLAADRAELTRLLAEQTRIKECVRDTTKRIDLLAGLIEGAPSESEAPRRPSRVNGELKPGSRIALAYEYLSEAGESLHIRDILVGIGAGDSSRTRDALATQINRYVASGRLFRQDVSKGPRVFGVLVDGEPGETPT